MGQEKTERAILIVDGYNVLRSSGLYLPQDEGELRSSTDITAATALPSALRDFADYSNDHHNVLRENLINDVSMFAHRRYEPTVVFDGAGNPHSTGERNRVVNVDIIFSAAGVSADSTIEELAHTASTAGHAVLVITSDATLQWTVLGERVTRMSAAGFADEIRALKKATVDEIKAVAHKNTLAERIDQDARDRLARMARGLE